jgi:hypothetical protein
MTPTGSWTNKDKLVTLEQLGRIQDENSPNELNGGKPFSEGYREVHQQRKKSLIYAKLSDIGQAVCQSVLSFHMANEISFSIRRWLW